jgi:hypothetical protein
MQDGACHDRVGRATDGTRARFGRRHARAAGEEVLSKSEYSSLIDISHLCKAGRAAEHLQESIRSNLAPLIIGTAKNAKCAKKSQEAPSSYLAILASLAV